MRARSRQGRSAAACGRSDLRECITNRSFGIINADLVALDASFGDGKDAVMEGGPNEGNTSGLGEKAEATIDFGAEGTKRLLLRYAPVEKL